MGKIYTYDEIRQEFEERGYILITDHKVKSDEKYEYVCKRHQDKSSQFIDWGHFHCSGRRCYYCGREKTEAAKRKDLSEYDGKSLAESKGFEYVDMVKHDRKIWVLFICPKHTQYGVQEMPYNNMKRVVIGCRHCIGRNDDEEEVLSEMYAVNPNIELLEPYQGRTKRIQMNCKIHQIQSKKSPAEVMKGKGCIQCGLEKLSIQARTPKDVFIEELYQKYNNINLTDGYISKSEYAQFDCNICGANWTDMPSYVITRGCPRCNSYSVESQIGVILQQYKINYIPQYSFNDCKDKKRLPFDYYLPEYNVLIEYDGEQHYMPVNFGGISDDMARENLKTTQLHDQIKNQYCNDNNISLIRIPYWEKKNLQNVLMSNLRKICDDIK